MIKVHIVRRQKDQLYCCVRGVVDIDNIHLRKLINNDLKTLISNGMKDNIIYYSNNVLEAKTFSKKSQAVSFCKMLDQDNYDIWTLTLNK